MLTIHFVRTCTAMTCSLEKVHISGVRPGAKSCFKIMVHGDYTTAIPTKLLITSFEALLDIKRPALKRSPWVSSHELDLHPFREFMEISERAEDNLLTVSSPQLVQTSLL